MNKSEKDKSYSVAGIAKAFTVYAVFDGSRDRFKDAPPSVTKKFNNTAGIRTLMDASDSSKVYAIVLESYTSKGVTRYEVSSVRMRSGFGKGNVKELVSRGVTQEAANRFFNQSAADTSAPEVKPEDVPRDDHHEKDIADSQGQGDAGPQVPPQDAITSPDAPPQTTVSMVPAVGVMELQLNHDVRSRASNLMIHIGFIRFLGNGVLDIQDNC